MRSPSLYDLEIPLSTTKNDTAFSAVASPLSSSSSGCHTTTFWRLNIDALVHKCGLFGPHWDACEVAEYIAELTGEVGFHPDTFCHRCKAYDDTPHGARKAWMRKRPLAPRSMEACHGCLVSYLDPIEAPAPELEVLKEAFLRLRGRIKGLNEVLQEESDQDKRDQINHELELSWDKLRRIADMCRQQGYEPFPTRTRALEVDHE